MIGIRRHQLVRLSTEGWRRACSQHDGADARRCIAHWAAEDLPLVVTSQAATIDLDIVSLGLPAPAHWGGRRLSVRSATCHLLPPHAEFPSLAECRSLPADSNRIERLVDMLACLATTPRVYGSHGWQHVTGHAYTHALSDVDLMLPVTDARHADDVAAVLEQFDHGMPRLDGELCFRNGNAVSWREWGVWRAGRVRSILVKRLRGATLEAGTAWAPACPEPTTEGAS